VVIGETPWFPGKGRSSPETGRNKKMGEHVVRTYSYPDSALDTISHRGIPSGLRTDFRRSDRPPMSLDYFAVPALTGPLDYLRGKRVIVLVDTQNLTASADKFGRKFSYRRLAELLRLNTANNALHAFFSATGNNGYRAEYFEERGYIPHAYPIHHVATCRGTERRSNIDLLFAAIGGAAVSRSHADVVLLCSGDGQLVCDMALAISMFPKHRGVATLSFAGATSNTLDAKKNTLIDANIEVGRDLLIREGRPQ